tara:strand:+ start:3103 stop:3216 length:114 start_codon:yes stop_codon:yes gene_type:complete
MTLTKGFRPKAAADLFRRVSTGPVVWAIGNKKREVKQ